MKQNNRKIGNILITVGTLCLVAAVIFAFINYKQGENADRVSREIVQELLPEIPTMEQIEREKARFYPFMEMPEKEKKGIPCIAVLEIPALELTLPVASVWTDANLKVMPCRYAGSAYSDDLVIAGHNYRRHFGRISKLKQGDGVVLTDMEGNIFRYAVDVIDILEPTDIEEMKAGNWDLSFFTCTPSRTYRVTVRCNKTE